jgi:hypothetical protein
MNHPTFHIISARPSKQPLVVRTVLKVYGDWLLFLVSAKEQMKDIIIFDKTKILVKGISGADSHAAAQRMLNADPSLEHLSPLLSPASFVVDCYIGLGVPIGN